MILVLVLLRVLAASSVTPPSIGTEDSTPASGATEYNPEIITADPDVLIRASGDSVSRYGPTRFQSDESTSLFDAVTSTDSTEWESFTVTSTLKNKSDGTHLDAFTEHVTHNKGSHGVQVYNPNRTVKLLNNVNESGSNTERTATTSGNDHFDPDNNTGITGTADMSDKSVEFQFRELTKEDDNNKEFQVMKDGTNLNPIHCKTFQEGTDTIPERFVPFLAENLLRNKITGMNLNKCSCPPYHLLKESSAECVATQASFVEVLTNPITSETCFVPEANFRQIQVINLSCHHPLQLHQMGYNFLLTGDAQHNFYDTLIKSSQFCMENIEFSDGHREWNIFACLEPPRIPKCCDKNQFYDVATMACVVAEPSSSSQLDGAAPTLPGAGNHNLRFTIPVEESVTCFTVPAEPQASAGTPTCSGGRKLIAIEVGKNTPNSASLVNSLHDVRLYVSHSDLKVYQYLRNTEYCVDWSSNPGDDVGFVAVFCYEDPFKIHHSQCSLSRNCIRKCCPGDEIIDMTSLGCTAPHDRQYLYRPRFYHHSWAEDSVPVLRNTSYEVVHGEPFCRLIDAQHKEDFYLLDDGTAYFPKDNRRYTSEYYCVDAQQGFLGQTDAVIHYCEESGTPYGDSCWRLRYALYPVLQVVSCVFLLVTLLVYKLLPELQRLTISGRSLPSHVLALFVASCSLLAIFLGQLSQNSRLLCMAMAFLTQFSLLATFFWLNVMCFEMWYRIRIQPTLAVSLAESREKYKLYSLYGWGLPALITVGTGIVQAVATSSPYTPNFGDPFCWFRPKEPAYWLHFSGFVILLCLANIFFFLDLAQITVKQCLGSTLIHHSTQQHMGRILLCLKLFTVMGITWIFEEIFSYDDYCARWFPTDIMNLLRGPFVFLSVVSTRSVLVKLKNKVFSLCHCVGGGVRPLFVPPSTRGFAVANPKLKATSLHLDSIRRYPTCRQPSESGSRDSLASVKTEETSIGPKLESSINPKADDSSSVYQRESSVVTQDWECSSGNESSEGQLVLDPAAQAQYEGSRQQGDVRRAQELVGGSHDEVELSPSQHENSELQNECEEEINGNYGSAGENHQSQDFVKRSQDDESRSRSENDAIVLRTLLEAGSPTPSRSAELAGGQTDSRESQDHRDMFTIEDKYATTSSKNDRVTVAKRHRKENNGRPEHATNHEKREEV